MTSLAAPLVRCERLEIGIGGRAILPPFDLSIAPGEVILLVGRNGSGKTTLLRTLLGLIPPIAGTIDRRAGLRSTYVPQASAVDPLVPLQVGELWDWATLRSWSFLRPRRRRARTATPDDLQVHELRDRRFGELSSGQRQRVLLQRLVDSDAELAALDEPTAAMDGPATATTYRTLRSLASTRQLTSVVATHEPAAAAPHANRIALLDPDEQGLVVGRPDEVIARPRFHQLFGGIPDDLAHEATHA